MKITENIVTYEGIGVVKFVRNRRARHLSIRINQKGELRVTVPGYVSMKRAEAFLMTRKQWILVKMTDIRNAAGQSRMPMPGEFVQIRGKQIQLLLNKNESSAEESLWRALQKEARDYLPDRVKALAAVHGLTYSGLKIRRMKTRWGSCTAKSSINLNSWLVMLPDHLSDYIILHELVHTRHRDHSKKYWEALDRVTGGHSKQLRKELRNHPIMVLPAEPADQ